MREIYSLSVSINFHGLFDSLVDFIHDELNTGHWSEVPESTRRVFTAASYIKAILILQQKEKSDADVLTEALKCLDLGLLLGAPLLENSELLLKSASYVTHRLNQTSEDPVLNLSNLIRKRRLSSPETYTEYENINASEISTVHCPSIETFNKEFFIPETPTKLKDCMDHWPAMTKWLDITYLITIAGNRTVPVELGSHYVDENWSQKLMTLKDFIRNHFLCDTASENLGYLAQHNLFDQISELRNDILVPDYCCLSKNYDESCEPDINAWFGPKHTVSPLHYDPKNNILAQVFGTKQIVLFAPKDSKYLYPHEGTLLNNTAQVNPLSPDTGMFPSFNQATMYKCLLRPGEMLYMPPKWWHHVTALDKSFSVSFWWQ
ncbi:Jumonji domain containing 5 [Carabus blaptoides fortunei]